MPTVHAHEEFPKRLDKETINELPLIRFHGAIHVAEDSKIIQPLCQSSKTKGSRIDIECKPNFKRSQ